MPTALAAAGAAAPATPESRPHWLPPEGSAAPLASAGGVGAPLASAGGAATRRRTGPTAGVVAFYRLHGLERPPPDICM